MNQEPHMSPVLNRGLPPCWGSEDPKNGAIEMEASHLKPLDMTVTAAVVDATGVACNLSLQLLQEGAPLLVWGNEYNEVDPTAKPRLARNNYYYSFTQLHAIGTVAIGLENFAMTGLTWKAHEYRAFPSGTAGAPNVWLLQLTQRDDGIHLPNFTRFGDKPEFNVSIKSNATIPPRAGYLKFKVEIDTPELAASFIMTGSVADQLFEDPGPDVYEGVGSCQVRFGSSDTIVSGTARIAQNLG